MMDYSSWVKAWETCRNTQPDIRGALLIIAGTIVLGSVICKVLDTTDKDVATRIVQVSLVVPCIAGIIACWAFGLSYYSQKNNVAEPLKFNEQLEKDTGVTDLLCVANEDKGLSTRLFGNDEDDMSYKNDLPFDKSYTCSFSDKDNVMHRNAQLRIDHKTNKVGLYDESGKVVSAK